MANRFDTFQSPISRANQLRAQDLQAQGAQQQMEQSAELQPLRVEREQLANQQLQAEVERFGNEENMRSMTQGALEFLAIDPNDMNTQNQFLQDRARQIAARGGDPQDTVGMLSLSPEDRQEAARRVVQVAQQMGIVSGQDTGRSRPSEIQIAEEVSRLRSIGTPESNNRADMIERMALKGKTGLDVDEKMEAARKEEFAKGQGRAGSELLSGILKKSQESDNMMATLNQMEDLLDEGIPTGPLSSRVAGVKALAADLGLPIDTETLAGQEAFEALGNQLALRMRNPDSGFGLTGNTSDRDVKFLKSTVPTSAKTEAGNRMIIKLARSLNRHNKRVALLAEQYAEDTGGMKNWARHLDEWKKSNNAISDELQKEARRAFGEAEGEQAGDLPSPTNSKGWTLMVDAQGNQAYVSPDGTQFEEVQ